MCRLPGECVLRWGLQSQGHPTTGPTDHTRQKAAETSLSTARAACGLLAKPGSAVGTTVFPVPGTGARVAERPAGPDFGGRRVVVRSFGVM